MYLTGWNSVYWMSYLLLNWTFVKSKQPTLFLATLHAVHVALLCVCKVRARAQTKRELKIFMIQKWRLFSRFWGADSLGHLRFTHCKTKSLFTAKKTLIHCKNNFHIFFLINCKFSFSSKWILIGINIFLIRKKRMKALPEDKEIGMKQN